MSPADRLPPLLASRPLAAQLVRAVLVPAGFGFICGGLLGSSAIAFLVLQLAGLAGGFGAGLEHDRLRGAAIRGLLSGALFGAFILLGHAVVGGDDHGLLPDLRLQQVAVTAALGLGLGILGAAFQVRRRNTSV